METKRLSFNIKDADKGEIEAVFSTFLVVDSDKDVTLPGAFEDGAPVRMSAYGHTSWHGELPVGRGVIRTTAREAIFVGRFFLKAAHARDTFEVVKQMGDLQDFSYGYDVLATGELTDEWREKGAQRVLAKLYVPEVSPVLRGAGVDTRTLVVKEATESVGTGVLSETPSETSSPSRESLTIARCMVALTARHLAINRPRIKWFRRTGRWTAPGYWFLSEPDTIWLAAESRGAEALARTVVHECRHVKQKYTAEHSTFESLENEAAAYGEKWAAALYEGGRLAEFDADNVRIVSARVPSMERSLLDWRGVVLCGNASVWKLGFSGMWSCSGW